MSRPYDGKVKTLTVKRNHLGEFFIIMVLDKAAAGIRKSHNGASAGIDFGLKTYMTLSDGTTVDNPQFLKRGLRQLRQRSGNLSKCDPDSHNRERRRLELDRQHEKMVNRRDDFQWRLAHQLCRQYDMIFIEDLQLTCMSAIWGMKVADLAHGKFVQKLQYLATRYGVTVHKIDRFYPSSKMCSCGYKNGGLQLHERTWTCPECGAVHKRDLLAANIILRQGIAELESASKSKNATCVSSQSRLHPRISSLQG